MRRSLLLTIVVSLVAAPLARAQSGPDLRAGDEVRIQAEAFSGRFRVVEVRGDSLSLQGDPRYAPVLVPVSSIRRLLVRRGPRGTLAGAFHHARMGLVIGGLTGGVLGLAAGSDPPDQWFAMSAGEKGAAMGIALGLVGGVAGAIIGAGFPGEHWEHVRVRELVSVTRASGGGLSVALTHRF